MNVSRRQFLRLSCGSVAGLLAGCAGERRSDSPTATPGRTPTTERTPTTLPRRRHDLPPGPKSPPDPPETWTEESAKRYAVAYEERRMYNSMDGETVNEITVGCSVESVEAVRGGYRVVVLCQGAAYYGDDGRHGDYIGAPIAYLVGNGTAVRTHATSRTTD
ncbi:hypothetical protein M0R88_02725 [Halorussus gelatinilyticus]|uniref:Uncharacterized protein n=1 Tax=Halorussus gelatinilyticus TaxID=2937524 RepID=A0A8U0IJ22_9EURY|nr:hypothetical protein [Halorussus gelatinilyticus]UPW01023.1 hypothetical protein M0R88_02725 [Halorussus gelatinilyticus]